MNKSSLVAGDMQDAQVNIGEIVRVVKKWDQPMGFSSHQRITALRNRDLPFDTKGEVLVGTSLARTATGLRPKALKDLGEMLDDNPLCVRHVSEFLPKSKGEAVKGLEVTYGWKIDWKLAAITVPEPGSDMPGPNNRFDPTNIERKIW